MPLPFVSKSSDLITPAANTRAGFLSQANLKTEKAKPYLDEAIWFYERLRSSPKDVLLHDHSVREQLVSSCGFSKKAVGHMTADQLSSSLNIVLDKVANANPDNWRLEIVFRYLLTKGDSLGGSMRNLTGSLAGKLFADSVVKSLNKKEREASLKESNKGKIQSISYQNRTIVFDKTPRFINKNIDIVLLDTESLGPNDAIHLRQNVLACGELKGGIDPAGADEHWKTANSAFGRIRTSFNEQFPPLFFVGAAIETAMAEEIFAEIGNGNLNYAANLTIQQQLYDLCDWLVDL